MKKMGRNVEVELVAIKIEALFRRHLDRVL